jgi:hypothetical protein
MYKAEQCNILARVHSWREANSFVITVKDSVEVRHEDVTKDPKRAAA